MTSRAPVTVVQFAVTLCAFVVAQSLQTDAEQREYQLVRCQFSVS